MTLEGRRLSTEAEGEDGSLSVLAVLALGVGAVSGALVALFLLLLERADQFRDAIVDWAHSNGFAGFLVLALACAAGAGAAAFLVRRVSPQAVGSGIPHVEAGDLSRAPFRIIPGGAGRTSRG